MDPLRLTIQYITRLCCAHGLKGELLILGMRTIKQPTPITGIVGCSGVFVDCCNPLPLCNILDVNQLKLDHEHH